MIRTSHFYVRLSRVALCVALALGTVPVQAQTTTSAVSGAVTSQDGKPITNAAVTVLHVESGTVSKVTTDAQGRYHARGLRVGGPYTITITKDGLTETRENVFLQLADTATVDVRLGAARQQTIVVS